MPQTRPSSLRLGAALIGLFLTGSALADDDQQWEQKKQTTEKYVANQPPLGRHRIDDVFRLRMENKWLVLRTPLASTSDISRRANLDGIKGSALVMVQRRGDDSGAGLIDAEAHQLDLPTLRRFTPWLLRGSDVPEMFNLAISDYSVPKQLTSLSITSQPPAVITISRSLTFADNRSRMVQLTQTRGPQSNGAGVVQFMLTESLVAGAAPTQLNFDAPDFFTFVREHPRETEQYLRPMLRELGQESVFAPEDLVVWQVFSNLWKPDPLTAGRVRSLLPGLEAGDYHARDAALRQLQDLGRDGAAVMLHMDRSNLTPEQNLRIDRALAPYAQLSQRELLRLRSDPGFLLDCLYSDDLSMRQAALDHLRVIWRPDIHFDVSTDPIARASQVAALRQQIAPHK